MPWFVFSREPLTAGHRLVVFPRRKWNEEWRWRAAKWPAKEQREYWCGKCLEMLGGALILRLVCLLWFLSPRVASLYTTTYIDKWRRGQASRYPRGNAFYSSYLRRNNSWPPQINPMAFSYSRKNGWRHVRRVRTNKMEVLNFVL